MGTKIPAGAPLVVFELNDEGNGTGEQELYCSEKCWEIGYNQSAFPKQSPPEQSVEHSPGTKCRKCGGVLSDVVPRRRKLFTHFVKIEEAMAWPLYKESLNWALVDRADEEARKAGLLVGGVPFAEAEVSSKIEIIGEKFCVTFYAMHDAEMKLRG